MTPPSRAASQPSTPRWLPWLAVLILAAMLTLQAYLYYARLPLSLGPRVILEPWLIRQGYLIYDDIVDIHTPVMPLLLAVLLPLFADGLVMAKVVLIVLISVTTMLTALASKRRTGWVGALWAAYAVVVWSPTFGFGKLWHEAFLTPLYLLMVLIYDPLAKHRSVRSLFLLGLVGGLAVMVKQHAAAVVGALLLWNALANRWRRRAFRQTVRESVLIAAGAGLPAIAFGLYHYARAGTWADWIYWTLLYSLIGPYRTSAALPPTMTQIGIVASAALVLPTTLITCIARWRQRDGTWIELGWGLVLLFASALTIYPRFHFFHMQPALPLLAWLSALTLGPAWAPNHTTLTNSRRSRDRPSVRDPIQAQRRVIVLGIALSLPLFWTITAGPRYASALIVPRPPHIYEYADLVPLAEQIEQHIEPGQAIYVFPDDEATANLYYLLQELPPKPWIFSYPWYMIDRTKQQILEDLEQRPPEWIVHPVGRWEIERHAPQVMDHVRTHYQWHTRLKWAQGEIWLLRRSP